MAQLAREHGVLVNIVDNLRHSDFITPAIVDRSPVTIAIGTEGAAPILARQIKAHLEEFLPRSLGHLTRIAQNFRPKAAALPYGRPRRAFWSDYFLKKGPQAYDQDGETGAQDALDTCYQHLNRERREGYVSFVGAGPGDPELLTLKARNLLHQADVVIYDRLVGSGILELARREAQLIDVGKTGFGPSTPQEHINDLIVEHARAGAHVVRLKGGDCTVFGRLDEEIDALDAWIDLAYHTRDHSSLGRCCGLGAIYDKARTQCLSQVFNRPRHEGICRSRLGKPCKTKRGCRHLHGQKISTFCSRALVDVWCLSANANQHR